MFPTPKYNIIGGPYTIKELVAKEKLPQMLQVTKGFYAPTEEATISEGQIMVAYFVRRMQVVRAEANNEDFSIPLNSSMRFSLLSNEGLEPRYNSPLELLNAPHIPKAVACENITTDKHGQVIRPGTILFPRFKKGTKNKLTKGGSKTLEFVSTRGEKVKIPLDRPAKFTSHLQDTQLYISEILQNFSFPIDVQCMDHDSNFRGTKFLDELTLLESKEETSLIGGFKRLEDDSEQLSKYPFELPLDLLVEVLCVQPQDQKEQYSMYEEVKTRYESKQGRTATYKRLISDYNNHERAQTQLYSSVREDMSELFVQVDMPENMYEEIVAYESVQLVKEEPKVRGPPVPPRDAKQEEKYVQLIKHPATRSQQDSQYCQLQSVINKSSENQSTIEDQYEDPDKMVVKPPPPPRPPSASPNASQPPPSALEDALAQALKRRASKKKSTPAIQDSPGSSQGGGNRPEKQQKLPPLLTKPKLAPSAMLPRKTSPSEKTPSKDITSPNNTTTLNPTPPPPSPSPPSASVSGKAQAGIEPLYTQLSEQTTPKPSQPTYTSIFAQPLPSQKPAVLDYKTTSQAYQGRGTVQPALTAPRLHPPRLQPTVAEKPVKKPPVKAPQPLPTTAPKPTQGQIPHHMQPSMQPSKPKRSSIQQANPPLSAAQPHTTSVHKSVPPPSAKILTNKAEITQSIETSPPQHSATSTAKEAVPTQATGQTITLPPKPATKTSPSPQVPTPLPQVQSASSNLPQGMNSQQAEAKNIAFLQTLDCRGILELVAVMKLSQYEENFIKEYVDGELLSSMEEDDLVELGISSSLHRKRFVKLIRGKTSAQLYLEEGNPYGTLPRST